MSRYGNPEKELLHLEKVQPDITIGSRFETIFINALHKGMYRPESLYSTVGTKLDKEQGTDAIYDTDEFKIRMDFTTNPKNKNNIIAEGKTKIDLGKNGSTNLPLTISLRSGNNYKGYTEFEQPVLIFSIDADAKTYRNNYEIIEQNIQENAKEILMAADDAWRDAMTPPGPNRDGAMHVLNAKNINENKKLGPAMKKIQNLLKHDDETKDNIPDKNDPIWFYNHA